MSWVTWVFVQVRGERAIGIECMSTSEKDLPQSDEGRHMHTGNVSEGNLMEKRKFNGCAYLALLRAHLWIRDSTAYRIGGVTDQERSRG